MKKKKSWLYVSPFDKLLFNFFSEQFSGSCKYWMLSFKSRYFFKPEEEILQKSALVLFMSNRNLSVIAKYECIFETLALLPEIGPDEHW